MGWKEKFDRKYYTKQVELNEKAIVKNSTLGARNLFSTIEKNLDLGNVYDISNSKTGFE